MRCSTSSEGVSMTRASTRATGWAPRTAAVMPTTAVVVSIPCTTGTPALTDGRSGLRVLEMLQAFERAVGRELPYEVVPRRPGDVAVSYADASKANAELGWSTKKSVDEMAADAWRWQSQNPQGFAG